MTGSRSSIWGAVKLSNERVISEEKDIKRDGNYIEKPTENLFKRDPNINEIFNENLYEDEPDVL